MTTAADKLRGLMEGATRGPWSIRKDGYMAYTPSDPSGFACILWNGNNQKSRTEKARKNMRLAVASVNLLPALAAVVEAARKSIEEADDTTIDDELAVMRIRSLLDAALFALDAAVAREVG